MTTTRKLVKELRAVDRAATAYIEAHEQCCDVERLDIDDITRRDAAMHDLRAVLGYSCGCDTGTCPGTILA